MYHGGYVPGVISLQVMQDGIPHLVIVPFPLGTGTAVHVLFCLFSSIEGLFLLWVVLCPRDTFQENKLM